MGEERSDGAPKAAERRRRRGLRLGRRLVALVVAVVLTLGLLPWQRASLVVPAVSPWVALCSAIALRSLNWAMLLGVPVLVLAVVRYRWFCRYACPVGLLTEQAGRLMPWTRGEPAKKSGQAPRDHVRLLRIADLRSEPVPFFHRRGVSHRLPHLGRWIALVGLAGALFGYPLLLWLDPLAIFAGFFSFPPQPAGVAAWLPAVGLPVVLLLSLLAPGAWCQRVCPLGAMQEMLAWRKGLKKGSGAKLKGQASLCVAQLANLAPDPFFSRRAVFGLGLGAAWATFARRALSDRRTKPIRPPGSVDEQCFSGLCVRCGNCVRACPAGIVHADLGEHGLASLFTPVVRFEEDYCRENCHRCIEVCPSGAIAPLSLDEKRHAPMGVAKVDMAICVLGDDRECQVCRNHCPYEAIAIVWSDVTYTCAPVVDADKCPGCGACEIACITIPQKAIRVVPIART